MPEVLGYSWSSTYGPIDGPSFQTWSGQLKQLTPEQIAKGVNKCAFWSDRFPPNLGQFVDMCTEVDTKPLNYMQFAINKQKRLAKPKPDKQFGRDYLSEMKQELGF